MSTTGFDTLSDIIARLDGVRDLGNERYEARCPGHEDRRQSLSIARAKNGGVVMKCHANCDTKDVLRKIGLEMKDLMPPNDDFKTSGTTKKSKPFGKIVAEYDYVVADGKLLYQAVRLDPKDFRQRSPNGVGGWEWKLNGSPRVLYRLPELLAADPHAVVFVPEGEKDVDRLRSLGLVATCNVGGAGKWLSEYSEALRGRHVIALADNDSAGRRHSLKIAVSLRGIAASVKILALPGLPEKGDVSDWLDAGGTAEELLRLAAEAPEEMPEKSAEAASENTSHGPRLTDWGNAQRLVARHGTSLRYCYSWESWLYFDSVRWRRDDSGEIERRAKDTVRQLWRDAAAEDDPDRRKEMMKFAHASEKAERMRSMISLARSEPGVAITPNELDRDPWLLCCPNCVVDLRTGEQRPHRREDYISKLCPTNYNPDAPSYRWDRFIESVFDGKEELISFVQRLFGYFLTGSVREQMLAVFWGDGSNGKTTLIRAYMSTLGTDFAAQAPRGFMLSKRNESHPAELVTLYGKRFVAAAETGEARSLDEATVKMVTGGEKIKARDFYEKFFEFDPTHKIVLATNHKPTIKGEDEGIWRRLALVPFTVHFWEESKGHTGPPELKADPEIQRALDDEREGILAWAVRGCLEWQRRGLCVPAQVSEATDKYRKDEDVVQQFIDEACVVGDNVRVRGGALYSLFEAWCKAQGTAVMNGNRFAHSLNNPSPRA